MQINISRDAQFILKTIRAGGHEAFAVGGCVRDCLMGKQPKDWDITTSMLPLDVKKLFRRTFDTGLKHGTVTVVLGRVNYEVTTYRTDGEYHDGRRPETVMFTDSIEDDLSRRDFTINAMAYNEERGLIDFFGGMKDLSRRMIRAVGQPEKRFTEDALRMLRAVRFAAQLGFEIEEDTFRAVCALTPRLKLISAERIREELMKLLLSPNPQAGMLMESAGMMPYILGGKEYGGDLRNALGYIADCPKEPAMVMALFVAWAGDECEKILRDLRFDNKTVREAAAYVKRLHLRIPAGRYEIKKILAEMPKNWFCNLLTLKEITGERPAAVRAVAQDIFEKNECVGVDGLEMDGNDLIEAGVPKGRLIGDALAYLLDEVHKHPELNRREELMHIVLKKFV